MMSTIIDWTRKLTGAAVVLGALLLLVAIARAENTITWIGANYPLDCSANGSVVVGNTGDGTYETFRWTADEGVVTLGRCTSCVLGQGGGTPNVSNDGNRVSATILGADSTYVTLGLWTKGSGWQEAIPPVPSDGGLLDDSYGSCWGISGSGDVITGFYWRPGEATTGLAHACTWSPTNGFTALPSPLKNCRGNAADYDGDVVVGWSERFDGVWQPTVWEDGAYTVLSESEHWTQAAGISSDGDFIVGSAYDPVTNRVSAAAWLRTEAGWQEQILGVLPGTFPTGGAMANEVTSAGDMVVGYNEFDGYNATGFVWTLNEGMVSAADWIAAQGLTLPANFLVSSLTSISADGRVITGMGYVTSTFPYTTEGFIISLDPVSAVPRAADSGGLVIESNHPNPFNPSTTLALSIDRAQAVRVEIFDVRGRSVRVLHDGLLAAGRHELVWDGRDDRGGQAASGAYLARARGADGEAQPRRMMLLK
jgi:hypothetical protein